MLQLFVMFLLPKDSFEVRSAGKLGDGVFTKKDIHAGAIIGDYLGKVIHEKDEDDYDKDGEHFYLMYYHDEASIYPDLTKPGIHLLNHACTPNTWMYTYKGHTLYFALRHIFAGEELTVSYQLSPQDKECSPCEHLCHCNSIICFTSMHMSPKRYGAWDVFQDAEIARTKAEPATFGKHLPPLSQYPKSIPDNPIYVLFGAQGYHSAQSNQKTMPSKHVVRQMIRESGRTLVFPKMNIKIHGVLDDLIISSAAS